ncbi:MAG: hypothetical protein H0T89_32495 [Deltaproteobacteria bacterium]|nr:hypothetical protein [Deltaproteobacteria bacterium]
MMAYRESADTSELAAFANHISIAETLLNVNLELLEQLGLQEEAELRRAYLQSWGDLWEQLDQARAIVVRLARDVSAYQVARARAGDPYLVAAGMIRINEAMREATVTAIATLRACVPEVVVPSTVKPMAREPGGARPAVSSRPSRLFGPRAAYFLGMLILVLVRCCLYMD